MLNWIIVIYFFINCCIVAAMPKNYLKRRRREADEFRKKIAMSVFLALLGLPFMVYLILNWIFKLINKSKS